MTELFAGLPAFDHARVIAWHEPSWGCDPSLLPDVEADGQVDAHGRPSTRRLSVAEVPGQVVRVATTSAKFSRASRTGP